MTIKPEGRKMLRIEKKNAESPIEQKPRWIRNQVRTGPGYEDMKKRVVALACTPSARRQVAQISTSVGSPEKLPSSSAVTVVPADVTSAISQPVNQTHWILMSHAA